MPFKIRAITRHYPTEDPKKIRKALTALLEGKVEQESHGEDHFLYVERTDYKALDKLHEMIRKQKILDVARKALRNGRVENSTVFFLNKQAAFTGKINFCDEFGESPLGPIRIEIEDDNLSELIDWLTPYTKNGVEVKLVSRFP
ncbi:MAG: hypothetical protein K9W42_10845 [Candidatus Heimdallarchaeota archaeon]|nr:hypothetical protein [Candidatus Heimdallarchaeota archaeon]